MGERHMNGATRLRRMGTRLTLLLASVGMLILTPPPATAVVGGVPVSVEQVPWQALVFIEPDNRLCGGAIIDQGWIATAAHCVVGFGGDDIEVHVGITALSERGSANRVQIAEVIVHPNWEARNFRNDIALLRLDAPIPVTAGTRSISLPVGLDAATWPPAGSPAAISGWGATEFGGQPSNQLRRADLQVLGGPSDTECGRYGANFDAAVEVCAGFPAGGVDSCQGDSGSPLAVDVAGTPMLAGLTSVGFECALADYPGIYTRITSFVTWIQNYLPAVTSVPSAPSNVTVQALPGERLSVQWQMPAVGVLPVSYRVDVQPAGRQCQVPASDFACVISRVPAGKLYEVVVTSLLPTAAEVSAEPVPVVSVDGVATVGTVVKPRRLATWSGLKVRGKDDVRLAVPARSREVCDRVGRANRPRGIRATDPGVCVVRVRVVRPNGEADRSVAYVSVRAE